MKQDFELQDLIWILCSGLGYLSKKGTLNTILHARSSGRGRSLIILRSPVGRSSIRLQLPSLVQLICEIYIYFRDYRRPAVRVHKLISWWLSTCRCNWCIICSCACVAVDGAFAICIVTLPRMRVKWRAKNERNNRIMLYLFIPRQEGGCDHLRQGKRRVLGGE